MVNSYINNITKEEQFICSVIPYNSKNDSFDLYKQVDEESLYKFAKRNLIESIVGYRLIERYGEEKLDSRWIRSYKETKNRITAYLDELDRVAKLFQDENIPLVALKNSGIAKAIYPYPGLVPMGDVDTLVRRSDFINAHKILLMNGYKIETPNKFHKADVNIGYRHGSSEYTTILSNGEQLWFELQWRPVEGRFLRPDQEPNVDDLMDRSISVIDSALRILSPEDNLLQVCLHTAKHSYVRAPGFRLHLDVDRIVSGTNIDWNILLENVYKHKVKVPVYFSLILPKVLFDTNIPDYVINKIQPNFLKKFIISKWLKKIGLFNPHEKKFGKITYLLWNAMLYDSIFGLVKSVFPKSNWMKNHYGVEKSLLLPYLYIKRVWELIFYRMKT